MGNSKAVSLLVEAGANVNLLDSERNTPLIYSVQSKDTSCMEILLKAGADTKSKNIQSRTALVTAMRTSLNPLCIEPLLVAGIDVNTPSADRLSPLTHAVFRNIRDSVATLLRCGADIESTDKDGDTPLMDSLFYNSDDALELLLASGTDYTKTDSYGDPVLQKIAIYGGLWTIRIVHEAKVKTLNLYAMNKSGKTAREIARKRDHPPDGFVKAIEIMLASIEAKTAEEALGSIPDFDDEDVGYYNMKPDANSTDVFYDALETH